ncbi:MAG: hypothetical protein ACRCYU_17635, partial [Nocardioides sp.]
RQRSRLTATPENRRRHPLLAVAWWVLFGAGVSGLGSSILGLGWGVVDQSLLASAGAVAVSTAYMMALAARTGGRPWIFGGVVVLVGVAVVWSDVDRLRTGAALLTSVLAAVLAVMSTVPAVRFWPAVREVVVAVLIAAVGAFASIGYAPVVHPGRFEYLTLGLSVLMAFVLVFRLGAGFHGLGRRGLGLVAVGGGALAMSLVYAEVLRRYGSPGLVEALFGGARWLHDHVGAVPRPIVALLGIPALAWGCHLRARRRQGWWLSAFGVTATAPIAHALIRPATPLLEVGLQTLYSVLLGLLVGFVLIRADLWLNDTRGSRARAAEQQRAVRPEPRRGRALL